MRPPTPIDILKRRGKFRVSQRELIENPDFVVRMFEGMVPLLVTWESMGRAMLCECVSPQFSVVGEGQESPWYKVVPSKNTSDPVKFDFGSPFDGYQKPCQPK